MRGADTDPALCGWGCRCCTGGLRHSVNIAAALVAESLRTEWNGLEWMYGAVTDPPICLAVLTFFGHAYLAIQIVSSASGGYCRGVTVRVLEEFVGAAWPMNSARATTFTLEGDPRDGEASCGAPVKTRAEHTGTA